MIFSHKEATFHGNLKCSSGAISGDIREDNFPNICPLWNVVFPSTGPDSFLFYGFFMNQSEPSPPICLLPETVLQKVIRVEFLCKHMGPVCKSRFTYLCGIFFILKTSWIRALGLILWFAVPATDLIAIILTRWFVASIAPIGCLSLSIEVEYISMDVDKKISIAIHRETIETFEFIEWQDESPSVSIELVSTFFRECSILDSTFWRWQIILICVHPRDNLIIPWLKSVNRSQTGKEVCLVVTHFYPSGVGEFIAGMQYFLHAFVGLVIFPVDENGERIIDPISIKVRGFKARNSQENGEECENFLHKVAKKEIYFWHSGQI